MDNTNKILIIAVIVLVGVLGIAGGFILQGFFLKNNNSTANQSNVTVNNTNNITKNSNESNNQSREITRDEAINIALANVGPINQDYYIETSYSVGNPHKWHVDFYNSKTNKHIIGVSINAVTGEVRAVYTI